MGTAKDAWTVSQLGSVTCDQCLISLPIEFSKSDPYSYPKPRLLIIESENPR